MLRHTSYSPTVVCNDTIVVQVTFNSWILQLLNATPVMGASCLFYIYRVVKGGVQGEGVP